MEEETTSFAQYTSRVVFGWFQKGLKKRFLECVKPISTYLMKTKKTTKLVIAQMNTHSFYI